MKMTTAPPVKLSPLFSETKKLGATFSENSGWYIPNFYSSIEEEVNIASQDVALVDASASSKVVAEGVDVTSLLRDTFNLEPLPISQGAPIEPGYVYRLRNDQYFLHLPVGTGDEVAQLLLKRASESSVRVTVTDVTHGFADLVIVGPKSPELLRRICALDFQPGIFPNLTAKHGSVARTRQLIIHQVLQTSADSSLPTYSLIGARSLALYLWNVILEAGQELAIYPIGQAALERIASSSQFDG